MKHSFKVGDRKSHEFIVRKEDLASFDSGTVHHVCSTFALAREMEWSSRLFVLEMIDDDEEGIGTHLKIDHKSPAVVGEKLDITALLKSINDNEIICDIIVKVNNRIIASGVTGQKILKRTKIASLLENL